MSLKENFCIGDHSVGDPSKPVMVAELACAHDGDADECARLIDAAASANADVIQLQVFRAESQVPKSHKIRGLLERLELDESTWHRLFARARATGCAVSAFVYDEESLAMAVNWKPDLLKLNSSDLNYTPMLEQSARTGIPISLGTGASTMEEIALSLEVLSGAGADRVFLMHGVQDFPTKVSDARLRRIGLLRELWNLPVGYADHTESSHTLAPWLDLVAIGQGASLLEKHLTMDRAMKKTDYQAALEPSTWKSYARSIREAALAMGDPVPLSITDTEKRYRQFQKKVAFAGRDIDAGQVLQSADLSFMRSDSRPGVPPIEATELLGKTASHAVKAGEIIPRTWVN